MCQAGGGGIAAATASAAATKATTATTGAGSSAATAAATSAMGEAVPAGVPARATTAAGPLPAALAVVPSGLSVAAAATVVPMKTGAVHRDLSLLDGCGGAGAGTSTSSSGGFGGGLNAAAGGVAAVNPPAASTAVDVRAVAGVVAESVATAATATRGQSGAEDARFVFVWNLPPEVTKRPLHWFQKRCGGPEATMAPVRCDLLPDDNGAESSSALLEFRSGATVQAFIPALDAWKVGMPRMRAQQATRNQIEAARYSWVLVRNLPAKVRNWRFFEKRSAAVERALILKDDECGRYALVELKTAETAAELCAGLNEGPESKTGMSAVRISELQKRAILEGTWKTVGDDKDIAQQRQPRPLDVAAHAPPPPPLPRAAARAAAGAAARGGGGDGGAGSGGGSRSSSSSSSSSRSSTRSRQHGPRSRGGPPTRPGVSGARPGFAAKSRPPTRPPPLRGDSGGKGRRAGGGVDHSGGGASGVSGCGRGGSGVGAGGGASSPAARRVKRGGGGGGGGSSVTDGNRHQQQRRRPGEAAAAGGLPGRAPPAARQLRCHKDRRERSWTLTRPGPS